MSSAEWSLLALLSSAVEQCQSIEFMPLTSTDEYTVYCHCEESRYLCLNVLEIKPVVNMCYSFIFSKTCEENGQLDLLTRVLLCYVTECLTSWNIRRRLVLSKTIDLLKELHFVELLLRLKPKSEQLFRYRRWLLNQADHRAVSVEKELVLCDQTAERHFVNYASWLHRRWLVEHYKIDLDEELDRNLSWLKKNISDSSGFSFRAHLLSRKADREDCIEDELKRNESMLEFYGDRESLWIYRQTLLFLSTERQLLLSKELELMKDLEENFFSRRYTRLLHTLVSNDGKLFRE